MRFVVVSLDELNSRLSRRRLADVLKLVLMLLVVCVPVCGFGCGRALIGLEQLFIATSY